MPKPTPAPATWSKPHPVGTAANCTSVTAGIDSGSRYHLAASCGDSIVYSVSKPDGSWSSKVFAHPVDRADLDPQIAFREKVVYVAFTRINPDADCGTRGADTGVFYRRTRPDGSWTDPTSISDSIDALEEFRVVGGTIHAVMGSQNAGRYYETVAGKAIHHYLIPDARSSVTLRVGTDGRARIAYRTPEQLRYAIFTGSGFSTSAIGGTREDDQLPDLALDRDNHAHLVWTRQALMGGCDRDDPTPQDGTYYGTNATGKWVSRRITTSLGVPSIQVDEVTGRVHVLVAGSGVRYYTKPPGGSWRGTKVASAAVQITTSAAAAIRLDPATGRLLIVYLAQQSSGLGKVYAITKP